MALALYDRVQETTTTTGTGTITLAGAVAGFQSFAVIGNGNTTYYCITSGTAWEVGLGTYTSSGTTLARTTVYSNSLGTTSPISLTGTSNVFVTLPAEQFPGTSYSRTAFTATAAQTTFTVSYTVGLIQVYVNGVFLNGADYTATNGTSIVLAVGCNAGDIVEALAFSSFSVASTVSSFSGGTTGLTPSTGTTGNVTLDGTLAVANGGTGVTTSTGSGSVVLGTSPTIATPTITSLYGQNSNLVSTPYNGTGLIPAELIYRLNSPLAGSNVNTVQSLFGVGTTLSGSTVYQFESVIALSKSAGTTSAYIQFLFGGTATLNNIYYNITFEFDNTSFTTFNGSSNTIWVQTASATQASASSTTAVVFYRCIIKGTVSINSSGTFIPQYQLSAAPGGAYTTAAGSYIKFSPMSASGANTNIGTWA